MEISKKYQPEEIESRWYAAWMEAKAFRSVPDERPAYTVVIPPPNVTGILHMGHVLNNTIQDVLVRRKRMLGFNACWVPGTDHASIATEAKVVKLLADQGIRKQDLSREEFLSHAFAWKDKYGGIILKQLQHLGASCDWDRTHFTMDEDYSRSVIRVFVDLYEKGLIYRGVRMVNWDPQAQTAVSDEEVVHKETKGAFYHVRYVLADDPSQALIVATTRPETILGDTAVAVHPEDPRYQHLIGKHVIVPMVNRRVPIIADEYIDREFGTGCLKVTPAHDINDYEIGIRHNLEVIDIFNNDGTISPVGELYVGMDRFAVRKKIVKDLEAAELLVKIEDHTHSVGYSERTDAVIEPKLSLQWFLKMKELAEPAKKAVETGEVKLIPSKFENTYHHWMDNVRDWCLSRQLWWGHQIPAWYLKGTNQYVVAMNAAEALEKAREAFTNPDITADDLVQDPDVLDTWASSWLWPISVFRGLEDPDNDDIRYYYPTNDLVTAPEILFFWVARMMMAGYEYLGKKPFENVYLTGIVRDDKRRKMSKQLGNSPDPLDLIAEYGADGVRVGMLLSSPAGNDLLFKMSLIEQGRNYANKLWNAFRLVSGWQESTDAASADDLLGLEWMESRMAQVYAEVDDHFSKFRISDALMSVYKLTWDDFCSWFLEVIKPEQGQPVAAETLARTKKLFEQILKINHPFMPFITEEIWQQLAPRGYQQFLMHARLDDPGTANELTISDMELVRDAVTAIRAWRSEKGMSPKEAISLFLKTPSPQVFEQYRGLLTRFLNLDALDFVNEQPDGAGSLRFGVHEAYIPMPQMDVAEERAKIEEEITYMEGFLEMTLKKLSNEGFVARAPEAVVAMERKKKEDAETKLALLRETLARL